MVCAPAAGTSTITYRKTTLNQFRGGAGAAVGRISRRQTLTQFERRLFIWPYSQSRLVLPSKTPARGLLVPDAVQRAALRGVALQHLVRTASGKRGYT